MPAAPPPSPPAFVEAPTYAEAVSAYPGQAAAQKIGGRVVLRCTPTAEGYLSRCATVTQAPKGYDFDPAARKLAARLRVTPGSTGEVRVTLGFTPDLLAGGPGVVRNPIWTALPTADDFQATVPKAQSGINAARVVLGCTVGVGGVLSDCGVDSEDPPGQGFGGGALALAGKFRVGALTADGVPTPGARIHLPIRYAMTAAAAKP